MIRSKKTAVLAVVLMILAMMGTFLLMLNPRAVESFSASTVKAYETKLFKENTLMQLNLVVEEDDWQQLLDNALSKEYIPADVEINGETFKDVGIRAKGNTSLSGVTNDRYSLKVEFDHYITGQTCYGLDKLALNNMYCDATYMKEYLSYEMMRFLDVPSSLCSFVKVSVNGEYWGLYLAVECLEESYMERNYGSDYGNLYKPDTMSMGGGDKGGMQPPDGFPGGELPDGELPDGERNFQTEQAAGNPPNGQNAAHFVSENGGGPAGNDEISPANGAPVPQNGEGQPVREQAGILGGEIGNNTNQSYSDSPNTGTDGGAQNPPPSESGEAEDKGNMGRGGFPGGMGGGTGATSLTDQGSDIDAYNDIFDSAVFSINKNDKQRLVTAIQNLNAGTDLERYVDVDEVLRYFAVNTLLVNLDSYASNMKHNYYLYEKDGQMAILPWDYNLAFGAFQSGSAESAVNFPIDTPVSGATLESSPLIGKLLEVEEYQERYHEYLRQLVEGYFLNGAFENTVHTWNQLIAEAVATDPTAFYSYDEYAIAVDMLHEFGALRAESVKGQLDGEIPSTEEGQRENPDALIDASAIDLNAMGSQGGGGGKNRENSFGRQSGRTESGALSENSAPNSDAVPSGGETGEGEDSLRGASGSLNEMPQNPPSTEGSPFGDMPDMKLMRQAMEIIGGTELDALSDEQRSQLAELGISEEELEVFSSIQTEMPGQRGFPGMAGPQSENTADWKLTALLLGISGILLIAGVLFAFCFRRRKAL